MKLVVALIAGFICIFPAVGFANPPASAPPEGMVHIPGGTYPMGSHKSLLELDPVDLFNTDRHALGPENPAHNVELEPYYIDMYEVTHGSYMKFVEATNAKKPRFWDDPDFNSPNQPVVGVAWKTAQSYCKWKGSVSSGLTDRVMEDGTWVSCRRYVPVSVMVLPAVLLLVKRNVSLLIVNG